MKNPKIFIVTLFLFVLFLIIFDFPQNFQFLGVKTPESIDLNIGNIHFKKDISYKLGLDLQGGTQLTYKVDMVNIPASDQDKAFQGARNIIERRINFFGVGEPSIQTLKLGNEHRVVVELPGLSNVTEATGLIGRTAELSFWEQGKEIKGASPSPTLPVGLALFLGNNPLKTKLSGGDLKSSQVVFGNTGSSQPQVQLNFTPQGTKLFAEITKRNIGKSLAIVLDNQLIEAPRVNQAILNGDAVITGNFTVESAKALSIQLNSGALPAPLKILAQKTIGPSLGIDSLKKSLFAGLLGFGAVVIFMSYLYKKEGIIASIALSIYIIVTLAIFKFIPITLTLAGIAGFILSIGMAVDANILIFERMKEESRAGKTKEVAVKLGFARAWSSIRDSNISSLITSAILYYFGTGIVRGFALTLAIGIIISMFSAIIVTRSLLKVFDKS
ncbi:MAG TPA: protein translocase subunit SecD [Candidatus Levybacteria bacterium]|nr:protein translocase subunit SecD [Candidatus Levybacteria bacterium]